MTGLASASPLRPTRGNVALTSVAALLGEVSGPTSFARDALFFWRLFASRSPKRHEKYSDDSRGLQTKPGATGILCVENLQRPTVAYSVVDEETHVFRTSSIADRRLARYSVVPAAHSRDFRRGFSMHPRGSSGVVFND